MKTERVENSRNPIFEPVRISGRELSNSNASLPLKFEVINGEQEHEIASANLSIHQIKEDPTKNFQLLNAQELGSGNLVFSHFSVVQKPSFVDYLRSGWGISLLMAIDFTASNGAFSLPTSLHHLGSHN